MRSRAEFDPAVDVPPPLPIHVLPCDETHQALAQGRHNASEMFLQKVKELKALKPELLFQEAWVETRSTHGWLWTMAQKQEEARQQAESNEPADKKAEKELTKTLPDTPKL